MTCGSAKRTRRSAGTCSSCPPQTALHCGSSTSNPDPPRTSPPRGTMCSPRCTRQPPAASPSWPTRATLARASASASRTADPKASPKGPYTPTTMFNVLVRHVRALGERAAAELKQRWRSLQHVTLSPSRIGEHSPSRTRPQRNMEVSAVEKTSVSAKVNTGHIRRIRCLLPRRSAPCRTPGPPR